MSAQSELSSATCEVKFFTITGDHDAKIVKVYDGDTVHAVFNPFGTGLCKFSVRLNGVDTPELRTSDPQEKIAAVQARDVLSELILNKIVKLNCSGFDKYGRLLATIYCDNQCINNKLIYDGLANKYDGGTKKPFYYQL